MAAAIVKHLIGDPARIASLFADQGALESTTEAPFDNYVSRGLSYAPLVLVYEAQYVGQAYAGQLPPDRVLVYLCPGTRGADVTILFGEGNIDEMTQVATLTGGKSFDAREASLAAAFTDIRGYQ